MAHVIVQIDDHSTGGSGDSVGFFEVSNDVGGFGGFIGDGFCGGMDISFFGGIGSFSFGGKLFGGKDITFSGGFGGLTGRSFSGGKDISFSGFSGGSCGVRDMTFGGSFTDVSLGSSSGWDEDGSTCGFVCFFFGFSCGNWSGMTEKSGGNLYGSIGWRNFVFGFDASSEFVLGRTSGGSLGFSTDKPGSSAADRLARLCSLFSNKTCTYKMH